MWKEAGKLLKLNDQMEGKGAGVILHRDLLTILAIEVAEGQGLQVIASVDQVRNRLTGLRSGAGVLELDQGSLTDGKSALTTAGHAGSGRQAADQTGTPVHV